MQERRIFCFPCHYTMHQFFTQKKIRVKQKSKACLGNSETLKCICLKSKRSEFISDTVLIYKKIFCLHLAEAERGWKSLLKFPLYTFLHKCAATENFLKAEEMKAGRGQVKETTFKVTTPWKNRSPYIVFFAIPKGKHIPVLALRAAQHCPQLGIIPPRGYARGTQLLSKSLGLTVFPGLRYNKD